MSLTKSRYVSIAIGASFILSCWGAPAKAEITASDAAQDVGITPQSIVIADLASQTNSILGALQEATDLRSQLEQQRNEADANQAQIEQELAALQLTGQQTSAELQNLRASLQQKVSDIQTTKEAIYDVATQALSDPAQQTLTAVIDVGTRRVPPEFRVLDNNEAQWEQIERALRYQRRAEQLNEPLDPQWASLLDQIESDSAVVSAESRLNVELPGVEGTFQNYEG